MDMGSSSRNNPANMRDNEAKCNRKFKYHRTFDGATSAFGGDLPATYGQAECSQDHLAQNNWRSGWSFICANTQRVTAISSGSYDNRIVNFIKSIPLGHKLDFTFGHELNAKVNDGSYSIAQITNAFIQARDVFDQLRSDGEPRIVSGDVTLTACITNANWNGKGSSVQNQYNDLIEVVDLLTIDIYGKKLGPANQWPQLSSDFMQWWENTGQDVGSGRIGLWETSANDSETSVATKREFIAQSTEGMWEIGAECFAVFDSNVNGSQPFFNRQEYNDEYRIAIDLYGGTTEPPPRICPAGTDRAGQVIPDTEGLDWCNFEDPEPPTCPVGTDRAGQVIPVGETEAWCDITDPTPPGPTYNPQRGLYLYSTWS